MDLIHKEEVEVLMKQRGKGPCISIYMPTYKTGEGIKQNPIRLKNMLTQADEQLTAKGVRPAERNELLEPARQLINNSVFWRMQGEGLAFFLAPGFLRYYRLPLSFNELAVVTDSFHLKPLLTMLAGDGQFYILALSQKDARLLQGTRSMVEEMDLSPLIEKFEAEFGDELPEQYLQFHTQAPRTEEVRPAIYFGHGGEIDSVLRERLLKYFRFIDKEVRGMLYEERAPLLLACVDYLFPLYKEANKYPLLFDDPIRGNPENVSAAELHRKAWEIVQPYFKQKQEEAVSRYHAQVGTGKTSNDIKDILPASFHGRVGVLFVAVGIQQWGKYNSENNTINLYDEQLPGTEDLLDLAAAQTFFNNGIVYAVDPDKMPDTKPLAALYRY